MIGDGNPIDLHKLPLADLLSYMEMNPPAIPWNALTNVPFKGVPFTRLDKTVLSGAVTGFNTSLGGKLDPANYQHLLIIAAIQSGGAAGDPNLTFNSDTGFSGTNYSYSYVGSASGANSGQPGILLKAGAAASTSGLARAVTVAFVPNFLESGEPKSVVGFTGTPGGGMYLWNGAFNDGAGSPITQYGFSFVNNLAAGSTFTAYALGSQ